MNQTSSINASSITASSIPASGMQAAHAGEQPWSRWRYRDTGATRDLRIDFMRGLVFVLLFVAHFEGYSWLALVAWERVGVVSSAETFIILAGVVTGMVYGKRLKNDGLGNVTIKLMARAWTLYKIAVIVAGSIALLRLIPGLRTQALTHFIDPVTGLSYALYPPASDWVLTAFHVLLLKSGPHQFQVVALYVALFLATPLIFLALERGRAGALLLLSWALYALYQFVPETEPGVAALRMTGAQFEYAFPLLAWQLVFVHGVVLGYYKRQVLQWFTTPSAHVLVGVCILLAVLLALFSLNHPLPRLPEWAHAYWMDSASFNWWYQHFFLKYKLGPGRLLNNAVLLIAVFTLLSLCWRPISKALGWFFIPLGQESMYVFFMHIYLILLVQNTPLPAMDNVWVNTLIHLSALLLCWLMVKTRFLFNIVPR